MASELSILQFLILVIIFQSILSKPTEDKFSSVILYTEKVNSNTSSLSDSHKLAFIVQTELEIKTVTEKVNNTQSMLGNTKPTTSVADKLLSQDTPSIKVENGNETDIILPVEPLHGQIEDLQEPETTDNTERRYNPIVPDPPITEKDRNVRATWGGLCTK
jgi:hypothetical protein